ncbi:FRITZ-like protein, partial [Mya arenaria]
IPKADHMIGCHSYHDKADQGIASGQPYYEEKQQFTEGRDMLWAPKNKRPEKLRDNIKEMEVLVWWSNSSKEAMPWSPMATDRDRANIIAVSCHGPNIDIMTFTRTECDPVSTKFSQLHAYRFYTVEQGMGSAGETTVKAATYEIVQNKIQRISVINIALKSMVQCEGRSPGEDRLVLGCADSTLVIYDENKKVTQMTRAGLIPSVIAWHPTGTIFYVGSARGDIQVYDIALSPLRLQLLSEEPNPLNILPTARFFKGPVGVLLMPLGVVSRERFSCVELVKEYIRSKQLEEAVSLLGAMGWDTDGASCYSCLTAIVTHLLKMPLNAEREVQLETAMGTFYAPKRALSEMTILDYRDPISRLARRFFHHLLRYARFDKAYLLAVDIGARDLFMDIHYMALDKGETALAEVSRRKAEQVDSESLADSFDDHLPGMEGGFYQHGNNSHVNSHNATAVSQNATTRGENSQRSRSGGRRVQYSDQQLSTDLVDLDVNADLISDYTAALGDQAGWGSAAGTANRSGNANNGVIVC